MVSDLKVSKTSTAKEDKDYVKNEIKELYAKLAKLGSQKQDMITLIEFDIRANTIEIDKLRVEIDKRVLTNNILSARLAELQR